MSRLRSEVIPVAELTPVDRRSMLALYSQYYECFSAVDFCRDLDAKNDVIVLRDRSSGVLKGFSTVRYFDQQLDGKSYRAVFSGDTILDRAYWGSSVLQLAFCWYMLRVLLRRPWQPVYWHLISKGYKTYLLLAHNFATFYPRHDRPTPRACWRLMDAFAQEAFGDAWQPDANLLVFDGYHEHLQAHVAPIHDDLLRRNPHVRFFAQSNPGWQRGDELVCLGIFDWRVPLIVATKALRKRLGGRRFRPPAPVQPMHSTSSHSERSPDGRW